MTEPSTLVLMGGPTTDNAAGNMSRHLLIRYHEVALKGKNRNAFVAALATNIRRALSQAGLNHPVKRDRGQIRVDVPDESEASPALHALSRVYGIARIAPALRTGRSFEEILDGVRAIIRAEWNGAETFRVSASRSDKRFPMNSDYLNREIGTFVREETGTAVKMRGADIDLRVDVRNEGVFLYVDSTPGAGGLPVGSSGHVLSLLSGGIDSPVAAARMLRRGCTVDFVHFHSFPLVDGSSRDKAQDLARVLNQSQRESRLHLVPFADVQRQIVAAVAPAYRVVAYRRFMMRAAQEIARRTGALTLVTGESIGQVASQTVENIASIDAVADMPVLRPLIGMDKQEIITEAQRIGTFDISILPDEDCCSLFVPRHPVLRSSPAEAERLESALDVDTLITRLVAETQTQVSSQD